MSGLDETIGSALADRYIVNSARVRELASSLTDQQFWQKPFPFGNSFGHLVRHLTGNLNYYIGAQIAGTEYVRDRPREFDVPNLPSKEEALERFDEAVALVLKTIKAQTANEWSAECTGAGSNATTRFDMILQSAAHMQHHIGQMTYLAHEWRRREERRTIRASNPDSACVT